MTSARPDDNPSPEARQCAQRPPKPVPTIEEVLIRPFLTIPDIAVLLQTTPDGIRRMMTLGTIPAPLGKRGRKWFWDRDAVVRWMRGDEGDWTPPPYSGPRPPATIAPARRAS